MRAAWILCAAPWLGACSQESPSTAGLAPERRPESQPVASEPARLEAPPELPAPATAQPAPAEAERPAPTIVFEVEPLGRFEVITWDEAARRADARIQPENAPGELLRVRQDILSRKR